MGRPAPVRPVKVHTVNYRQLVAKLKAKKQPILKGALQFFTAFLESRPFSHPSAQSPLHGGIVAKNLLFSINS